MTLKVQTLKCGYLYWTIYLSVGTVTTDVTCEISFENW